MSVISSDLNQRSLLALVACDMSYRSETELGDGVSPLATSQDSLPETNLLPVSIAQDAGIPHHEVVIAGKTEIALGDWVLENRHYDATTGFSCLILYSADRNEYLVALTGTNGPDLQDWYNNLNYSTTQWRENEQIVRELLSQNLASNPNGDSARVTFTGQSLGGALSQFAAYDFVESRPEFERERISLITFNGLGAFGGMRQLRPGFDPQLLTGVETAHYAVYNDIVHRLGEGNFNAANNTYLLDFRFLPGQERALNIVDAHRIESGFYRGFSWPSVSPVARDLGWGSFQTAAKLYDVDYLQLSKAQELAAGFGQLLNDSDHSPAESLARSVAGLAWGLTFAGFSEIQQATFEFLWHARRASALPESRLWDIASIVAPLAIKHAALQTGPVASVLGLLAGIAWDAGEDLADGGIADRFRALVPDDEIDVDVAQSIVSEPDFVHSMFKALLGFRIADGSILPVAQQGVDSSHVLGELFTQPDWLANTLQYLAARARNSNTAVVDVVSGLSNSVSQLARTGGEDASQLAVEVASTVNRWIADVARGVGNAFAELSQKAAGVTFDLARTISTFAEIRILSSALADQVANADLLPDVREDLEDALHIVEQAGQVVVVRPGREPNPFDQEDFNPEAMTPAAGAILEGSLSTFTVYLPYQPGSDGQHVRLDFAGAAAGEIFILAGEEETALESDGSFVLKMSGREASFSVVARGDFDNNDSFAVSAALVDEAGNASHLRHQEATITLNGEAETAPAGGLEYHGDWEVKYYRLLNADGTPAVDDLGQPIYHSKTDARYPHLENVERSTDPVPDMPAFYRIGGVLHSAPLGPRMSSIRGHAGADEVWMSAGGGSGAGMAQTLEGDDRVTGSELASGTIYAGAGNDWVEAGGYELHEASYIELERWGRTIGHGDDEVHGGAGDDRLYGEREATVDALYDPATAPTGLPGDWIGGGSGNDKVFGGAGDDVLMGGLAQDTLVGGAGRDVLLGDDDFGIAAPGVFWTVLHPSFGTAEAGSGEFELGLFPVYNYYPNVTSPTDTDPNLQDPYVSYYKEGGGADVLVGGAGGDILIGQLGDDTLYGGEDDDILAGWEGADQIFGGAGDDRLAGEFGRYEQPGQRRIQQIELAMPGLAGAPAFDDSAADQAGDDLLDGGGGNDVLFGEGGNDVVLGGEGNDTLYGDAGYLPLELHGDDLLDGGAGDDALAGGAGDDRLLGGDGDDTLAGELGNDMLEGGTGDDALDGGEGDDELRAGDGADTLNGGAGADVMSGGAGDDGLRGDGGDDILQGDSGADQLAGGAGSDALLGGMGEDVLEGGDGDDVIDGGAGADLLRGGKGEDTYVMGIGYGEDVIEDVEGENRLRFGAFVLPEDLGAALDSNSLAATLTLGSPGDAVSFDAGHIEIGAVEFSNGVVWSKADLVGFMPAVVSQGSAGGDALIGNSRLRNDLRGGGGDDRLEGGAYGDALAGGDGDDELAGGGGSDRYLFTAGESGIDVLSDPGAADAALEVDVVELGAGLALEDLALQVRVDAATADEHPEQPWQGGGTLSVRWGAAGFDVRIPDASLGLGEGVESFRFAGGAQHSLEEILRQAEVVRMVDYPVARGSGEHELDAASYNAVRFETGIEADEVLVSREGLDLRIDLADASASVRVAEWFAGPPGVPEVSLRFALEPDIGPDRLSQLALTVQGSGDDDQLDAVDGFPNVLHGNDGQDVLRGGSGADYLDGGAGDDFLEGRAGDDVYVLGNGYGEDELTEDEDDGGSGFDTVRLAAGIAPADVSVERDHGDLVLSLNGGADSLAVASWFREAGGSVEEVRFGDGTAWDAAALEAMLPPEGEATDGADTLAGLTGEDVLAGLGGDDEIYGFAGADTLEGGAGHDYLEGGKGDDTYLVSFGAGVDEIFDEEGNDRLVFGAGIAPADVEVSRDPVSLFLAIGGEDSTVTVWDWLYSPQSRIERIEFADGTVWEADAIWSRFEPAQATDGDDELAGSDADDALDGLAGNDAIWSYDGNDVLAGGEGDDRLEGGPGANLLEGGAGADQLGLQGVAYRNLYIGGKGDDEMGTSDGGPAVVAFNAGDGVDLVSAGPGQRLVVSLGGLGLGEVSGMRRESGAVVLELGEGDALYLDGFSGAPSRWASGTLQIIGADIRQYDLNAAIAALDAAQDGGDWSAAEALAANLVSASTTHAFGGVLAHQYATTGSTGAVTLAQKQALVADADFALAPQPIALVPDNAAPVPGEPIAGQSAFEDAPFAFEVPAQSFFDEDPGDVLAWNASRSDGASLPAWLVFDAASRTFSGTPRQADVDAIDVRVRVTDGAGLSATQDFSLTVQGVNDAPTVAVAMADRSFDAGSPFVFAIPPEAFADEDPNDALVLAASLSGGGALPGWLSFDAAAASFSGNPAATDIGAYRVLVTASDLAGAAAASDFALVVRAAAGSAVTGGKGDDTLFGASGDEALTARGGNDYLFGDAGNDELRGGGGSDLLQGGEGNDLLRGGSGQNLLDGGAGDDVIFGGRGAGLIAGGTGNDTIRAGAGRDVILFNRGDGADTLIADRDGDNTLSFGGGIRYSDLSLSREGRNLVVSAGADDRVVLKNWYGGKRSVVNLQLVLEEDFDPGSADPLASRRVQSFDFLGLVGAFDAARAATPGLTSWALTNALLRFHLSGADDLALGGDLAYWYGRNRGFAGISLAAAQQVIGAPGFGAEAQALRPFSGLQEGFMKLS